MLSQHIPQSVWCLVLAEERGEVADVELRHLQGLHLAQLLGPAPRLRARARHRLAQPLESLVEAVHPLALAVVGVPPPLPDARRCQPQLLQLPGGQRLVLPALLVPPARVPARRQVLLEAGGGVEAAAGAQVAAEVLHGVTGHPGVTGVVCVPGPQVLTPGVQVTPGVHGGGAVAEVEAVSEGGEGGEVLLGLGLEAGLACVGLVVVVVEVGVGCAVVGCHGDSLLGARVGARLRLGGGTSVPGDPQLRVSAHCAANHRQQPAHWLAGAATCAGTLEVFVNCSLMLSRNI